MKAWMPTLAALCLLTSCAMLKPRVIAPEPPRIDCSERAPAEPLPAIPRFPALPTPTAATQAWQRYVNRLHAIWSGHAVRAYGAYEAVVTQRIETANCLDRDREAGRIR